MGQSFACLNYHMIFATKERRPHISPVFNDRLYAYMGGIVRNERGVLLAAGGMPDHVHLLVGLRPDMSVSETLRLIKANSSKWIHETFAEQKAFGWQSGYAAFTVSQSIVPEVTRYIGNQEEHHKTMSLEEEYLLFLKRHGLQPDPRFLWS